MNNILVRSITGAIFITIMIGGIILSETTAVIVLGVFMFLGLHEFYRLFDATKRVEPDKVVGLIGGVIIFALLVLNRSQVIDSEYLFAIIPLVFITMIPELYRAKEKPMPNVALTVFGWMYVVLPFFVMLDLRGIDGNSWMLPVGMFLIIWSNDTFAYLTGKFFGKTKLFERISPNKTWEGTIGGISFALLAGFLIGTYSGIHDTTFWMVGAAIIAPAAIYGDLIESMLKRSLSVKDSGNVLPGHGGILDRFDAALFAAPLFFTWTVFYT